MTAAGLLWLSAFAPPLAAEHVPFPEGQVILTVTGDLARTTSEGKAELDLAMLRAIGEVTITTSTIWTEGVHQFTGLPLSQLAAWLGVETGTFEAWAINDYVIELPLADSTSTAPILAWAMDGEPMSVRDKGPIWVVYPYDSDPAFQTEITYARSIWQLHRLDLLP